MPTAALTLTSPQNFPHHLPSSKGSHLLHLPSEKNRPSRISTKHNIIWYNNPRHVWASISKLNKAIQQELKHSTRRKKSQRQPLITARSLARTPGYSAITYAEDRLQTPTDSLISAISLDSIDSVLPVLMVSLSPFGSFNPSSHSSTGFPELCLMFGCGTFHKLPLFVGWRLWSLWFC